MEQEKETIPTKEPMKTSHKWAVFVGGFFTLLFIGVAGGVAILHSHYQNRVLPNIFVGEMDLGGLTQSEARIALETWQERWWNEQMQYSVQDEKGHTLADIQFYPLVVNEGEGNTHEFIWFDIDKMVSNAFDAGHGKVLFQQVLRELGIAHKIELQAVLHVDEDGLRDVLSLELEPYETIPSDAQYDWRSSSSKPTIVSEQQGNIFNYEKAILDTKSQLAELIISPIIIERTAAIPKIEAAQAQALITSVDQIKEQFPLTVTYQDPIVDIERKWTLSWDDAYQAIQPIEVNEKAQLGLKEDLLNDYWERIESLVNTDPSNARFEINEETKKVEQFQPSISGYTFERGKTLLALNQVLFQQEEDSVEAVVAVSEPEITTADVNDLGITEVLGVGYSNFSGSPRNRVHNIRNGIEKLNGILIAPDEVFSLISALKPFTYDAGYLPELVIKGDKITPEIGGGLCQIGSTTFRAAMKSGLEIVERRNHSLVVNYYNDHRNGNPGTDATLYDPAPDFKFKNTTANYILLKTEMDTSSGDLWFTFWGTNDGRVADYTEPVVHRWIPTGPTKYIETTDLAPGEQKCQGAHPGANTSFTYHIEYPDGTKHEEEFTSSYRALPTICLVGVDPNAPAEQVDGGGEADDGQEVAEEPIASEALQSEVVS